MRQSPEVYPQDQLVVDLPGLKHIEDELDELGVGCVVERDENLGLALLTELVDAGGVPVADLDDLLIALRTRSGSGAPEMGKNREPSPIGSPVVSLAGSKIMSVMEPHPVNSSALPTPPGPGTGQGSKGAPYQPRNSSGPANLPLLRRVAMPLW